jgi:hypothetical protein
MEENNVVTLSYVPWWRYFGEIYCVTNLQTGQRYVGKTTCFKRCNGKLIYRGYQSRYRQHLADALSCNQDRATKCQKFYQAIRQYGPEAFQVTLVERCPLTLLDEREIYYIRLWKTRRNGYNMARGGKWMPRRVRKRYKAKQKEFNPGQDKKRVASSN